MSSTFARNIALTRELEAYIQAQVASGLYSSFSDVMRPGLRLLIERDEARATGGSRHARSDFTARLVADRRWRDGEARQIDGLLYNPSFGWKEDRPELLKRCRKDKLL